MILWYIVFWSMIGLFSFLNLKNLHIFKSEAALHMYSYKKVFWKYESDLQDNTHAEVRFQ